MDAKAAFLSQQKFWSEWLETQNAEAFAPMLEQSQNSLDQLYDRQSEMTSQQYLEQTAEVAEKLAYMKTAWSSC